MTKSLYVVGDYHCQVHYDRCSKYLADKNIDFDVFSMCNIYAADSLLYSSDHPDYLRSVFNAISSKAYANLLDSLHSSLKDKVSSSGPRLYIPRRDLSVDGAYTKLQGIAIKTNLIRRTGGPISVLRLVDMCIAIDLSLAFGYSSIVSLIDCSLLRHEYIISLMQLAELLATDQYSSVITYNSYGYCLASSMLASSLQIESRSFTSTQFLPAFDHTPLPYKLLDKPVRTHLQYIRESFEDEFLLSSYKSHSYSSVNPRSSPSRYYGISSGERGHKILLLMSGLTEKLAELILASDSHCLDTRCGGYLLNAKIELTSSLYYWLSRLNVIAKESGSTVYIRRHPSDTRQKVSAYSSDLVYKWISNRFPYLLVGSAVDTDVHSQIMESNLVMTFGSSLAVDAVRMRRKVLSLERTMTFLPDIPGICIHASRSMPLLDQISRFETIETSPDQWFQAEQLLNKFYQHCVA